MTNWSPVSTSRRAWVSVVCRAIYSQEGGHRSLINFTDRYIRDTVIWSSVMYYLLIHSCPLGRWDVACAAATLFQSPLSTAMTMAALGMLTSFKSFEIIDSQEFHGLPGCLLRLSIKCYINVTYE